MNDVSNNQPRMDPRDETPDSLMDAFKGRRLAPIIMFTFMVHVIVLGGSSVPFFARMVFAKDTSDLSEKDRIKAAVEEATPALRKIAEKHNLNPQQLSAQFAGGASRAARAAGKIPDEDVERPPAPGQADSQETEEEKPESEIEKELDVKLEGPKQPSLGEEKDIF